MRGIFVIIAVRMQETGNSYRKYQVVAGGRRDGGEPLFLKDLLRIAADQNLGPAGRRNGRAFGFAHDTTWLLGETGTIPVRCMSDPHMFQQPEYTWDYYYKANVNKPTVLNDQGGVHTNSSLLNNVAWRLCEKGGMTLEEARAFWFAVDGSMVPHTDYAQLSALMPWVLRNQGLENTRTPSRRRSTPRACAPTTCPTALTKTGRW